MHELIANDWLDHDYIERHTERLAGAARARAAVAARARRRGLRHHGRRGARPGARLRHDAAGGDPPELRHAARARRRQRGAAGRDPALPRRRLAAPRGRPAAVELGLVPGRPRRRCSGPTCWPGAAPRTINMSTIGDDLLRERRSVARRHASARRSRRSSSTTATRSRWRRESAKVVQGFAREDLFTVVLEHFLTDTADHADYRAAGHDAARAPGRARAATATPRC